MNGRGQLEAHQIPEDHLALSLSARYEGEDGSRKRRICHRRHCDPPRLCLLNSWRGKGPSVLKRPGSGDGLQDAPARVACTLAGEDRVIFSTRIWSLQRCEKSGFEGAVGLFLEEPTPSQEIPVDRKGRFKFALDLYGGKTRLAGHVYERATLATTGTAKTPVWMYVGPAGRGIARSDSWRGPGSGHAAHSGIWHDQ